MSTARPATPASHNQLTIRRTVAEQDPMTEAQATATTYSPGGVVTSGLSIYDTMQYIRPAVSTLCVGQAASMGSLLLAAGAKDMRFSLPNSRIMVHQPSGGFQGQASDIERHAQDIIKIKRRLNEIYVHHTGQSYETIEKTLDRDHFMDPEEAVSFGLIDKVLNERGAPEES